MTRNYRRLTSKEIAAIRKDARRGMYLRDIAIKYERGVRTVSNLTQDIPRAFQKRTLSDVSEETRQEALRMRNEDYCTIEFIMDKLSLTYHQVKGIIGNKPLKVPPEILKERRKKVLKEHPPKWIRPTDWGFIPDASERKRLERRWQGELCKENWPDSALPLEDKRPIRKGELKGTYIVRW